MKIKTFFVNNSFSIRSLLSPLKFTCFQDFLDFQNSLLNPKPHEMKIRIYFGNIGCGKTTTAVRNMYLLLRGKNNKRKKNYRVVNHLFSNFGCSLSHYNDLKELGKWSFPPYSHISIDEAGIVYNNRKFKSLPMDFIEYIKLIRHYKVSADFYSQSWDDMDITIRRLAHELWYVKKIGPFTMLRRIYKKVGIDSNTHQIVDFYEFGKLWEIILGRKNFQIFLRKPYYKYFDTHERKELPILSGF